MTDRDIDRRQVLGRTAGTAAGAGLMAFGGLMAAGEPAAASSKSLGGERLSTHPVLGTWRGLVTLPHEVEVALFTFLPGGFFVSFADGIHIAAGRWIPAGSQAVRFMLWQVLPQDLKGLPHRYNGEVQARHEAHVNGDTLTSNGTWRGLDIDGNETGRGPVSSRAVRFSTATALKWIFGASGIAVIATGVGVGSVTRRWCARCPGQGR